MKNYKKKYNDRLKNLGSVFRESRAAYDHKCLHCYEPLTNSASDFHEVCNKKFFGQLSTPLLAYDLNDLKGLAKAIIQSQMAVTGVQAKLSLSLHRKEEKNLVKKLTIVGLYGDYILKPPSDQYPELPELESATMHMADVCGRAAVPQSIMKLQDGTVCYVTKRVDRTKNTKLHMEDMCQLSERQPEDKYKGSHEQVAKLLLKYSSTALLDVSNFYEQVLFSFFTGNADMHLKNFSLLEKASGGLSLCPAYDLVPTALVNPADKEELALSLNAKKRKLHYTDFLSAYLRGGLSKKVLDNSLELFKYCKPEMEAILERSFVSGKMKKNYLELLNKRFRQLDLA